MKIVLYQPEIPQNTGNIARTCAATGTGLILVRPLGFSTQSRHMKRAGLDYWDSVEIEEIDDLESYLSGSFYFFSSKATQIYTEAHYAPDSLLIFGSETRGLPPLFREKWPEKFYTLPMRENQRCLNLATSASIVLYEALRQHHFAFPKREPKNERAKLAMTEEAIGT